MKKWLVCFLSLLILGAAGSGNAWAAKNEVSSEGLENLVFPKTGAIFFLNGGLRGDEKVEEQVRVAVHQKLSKEKNLNYLNDGLMSAKFQEYAFRKNILDGNDLFPYGMATEAQLLAFAQENRLHSLVVVRCYLRNVDEKQSDPKPGVETTSDFTSTIEIEISILNPDRNGVIKEYSFIGEGKSRIAIKSYWSAASKAVGKLKSEWKPEFY